MSTATLQLEPELTQFVAANRPLRYHAFDYLRGVAMLLGVVYHWQYVNSAMGGAPKGTMDNWIHGFRMGLFFLIAGFFGNMMMMKYGYWKYLGRRWWRVGAPLLVSIFALAGLQFIQNYYTWAAPPTQAMGGGGMMAMGGGGMGMGGGGMGMGGGGMGMGGGGMGMGGGGMPGAGGPGFGGGTPAYGGAAPGFGGPPGYAGGMPGFGGYPTNTPRLDNTPVNAPNPMMAGAPPHPWMDWILSKLNLKARRSDGRLVVVTADMFGLQHLWFLWYLLVFATLVPFLAKALGWVFARGKKVPIVDRFGTMMLRFDVAPLVLGLVTLLPLVYGKGPDWNLTHQGGFMGVFPDFVAQFRVDMPFYILYFLAGWWLFRLRDNLDCLAKPWLFNLFIGISMFLVSQAMNTKYNASPAFGAFPGMPGAARTTPPSDTIFYLAFGLYAVGVAYSGFGLLGLFQKYMNRGTKLGKYFTDTVLWVYLTQLAINPYVAGWVDYNNAPWWLANFAGAALTTIVALTLFEVFIRPTPLICIFGPAGVSNAKAKARRPAVSPEAAATAEFAESVAAN